MSQDIVERLQKYSEDWRDRAASAVVVLDAAEIITTLRAERDAANAGWHDAFKIAAENQALVQSMREDFVALRGLVDPLEITDRVMAIRRIVDAALSRSEV